MYSFHRSPISCLKLLAVAIIVLTVTTPPPTLGNALTKRQFSRVVNLLEESLAQEIPSDNADEYADLLYQEQHLQRNLTYYHAGDPTLPVFISNGFGSVGQPLHVLLRGEDYINPKNQKSFVVLRKMSSKSGEYSVHQAHIIYDLVDLKRGDKVIWNDVRVEQLTNVKELLKQMGNPEVQARSVRSRRPLCDWIGYTLYCQTPKNIPPVRPRQEVEPLDEEDTVPVNLYGLSSDENSKYKRQIPGVKGDKNIMPVENRLDSESSEVTDWEKDYDTKPRGARNNKPKMTKIKTPPAVKITPIEPKENEVQKKTTTVTPTPVKGREIPPMRRRLRKQKIRRGPVYNEDY